MLRFSFLIFFLCLFKGLFAQLFTTSQLQLSTQQLKAEQQLIKQNNNISTEKKLALLSEFGLLVEAQNLLNSVAENNEGEFAKAIFYKNTHQYKKSLLHIENALLASPENRDALLLKAEVLLLTNKPIEAQKTAEVRLAKVSFDDRALIINAKVAIALDDFITAKAYVKKALDVNNNNAEAWYLKAYIDQKNNVNPLDGISNCLSLDPYHPKARTLLGQITLKKDATLALLNWELAALKTPFYAPPHQAILQVTPKKDDEKALIRINNSLSKEDLKVSQSSALEGKNFLEIIKETRNIYLNNNLLENCLLAFQSINKRDLPKSIYHTLILEAIYSNEALDFLEKENFSVAIKDLSKNIKPYLNETTLNGLLNIALGEYSTPWELLVLNKNEPNIQFYKSQPENIAYYQIIKAISSNNDLRTLLMDKVYRYCMPANYKREFRKFVAECDNNVPLDFDQQYGSYIKKERLSISTTCDSSYQFFKGLNDDIKENSSQVNIFKAEAFVSLANTLIDIRLYKEAETAIQTALTIKPRYVHALLAHSKLRAAQNNHEEASLWYKTAAETAPSSPEVYITEALLEIFKFENGRISAETAFNNYAKAYAKAISLEKDPYLFSKYNRDVQEILKLFGKYNESLELAEVYLSKKVNNHQIFENQLIEETKAFATGVRVLLGNGNKLKTTATNLLEKNQKNRYIHDRLLLAYSHHNQLALIINKVNNISPLVEQLKKSKQSKKVSTKFLIKEISEKPNYINQLVYLEIIITLIKQNNLILAKEILQNFSYSKIPEIRSNYHYARANLLLADKKYNEAGLALTASLDAMQINFRSYALLQNLSEEIKDKSIKKAAKKQKKKIRKLTIMLGPDIQ